MSIGFEGAVVVFGWKPRSENQLANILVNNATSQAEFGGEFPFPFALVC